MKENVEGNTEHHGYGIGPCANNHRAHPNNLERLAQRHAVKKREERQQNCERNSCRYRGNRKRLSHPLERWLEKSRFGVIVRGA